MQELSSCQLNILPDIPKPSDHFERSDGLTMRYNRTGAVERLIFTVNQKTDSLKVQLNRFDLMETVN
ncbi:MAG: hypothetical protein WBI53_10855 [Paludibacter sp.]